MVLAGARPRLLAAGGIQILCDPLDPPRRVRRGHAGPRIARPRGSPEAASCAAISDHRPLARSTDRAIRAYAIAVIDMEWPRMEYGEASPEAEAAQDELLQTVAQSDFAVADNAALARLLLDTALRVREARSDRLAFASDFSENFKWSCVLLMGLMAQISLAAVHLDEARAQFAAMVIFTTSIVLVIGLIAAHEGPFQPPLGISPAPIAKLLDIVPDS
jgi:hypothetical protein